jgi:hypothetical protein
MFCRRRNKQFDKGYNEIIKSTDVLTLMNTLRRLSTIERVLFDKKQLFLSRTILHSSDEDNNYQ